MTVSQRIKKIINWLIFIEYAENERDLADKMGYTKSSFSQIVNGRVPLSEKFVKKLCSADENINEVWITDEVGDMLKSSPMSLQTIEIETVPLLPVAAQGGSLNDFVVSVKSADCEKIVSPIKGVDLAITVAGDSMAPEYPSGSQILIKKINEKAFIDWGKVYVLDTCNGTIIKEVHEIDGDETAVMCHSINPAPKYKPFKVSLCDVYGMYRVVMCMSLK